MIDVQEAIVMSQTMNNGPSHEVPQTMRFIHKPVTLNMLFPFEMVGFC